MPCSLRPEDGGSMDLRNVGILPQHFTALKSSRRPQLESSPPWEPQISTVNIMDDREELPRWYSLRKSPHWILLVSNSRPLIRTPAP